MKKKLYLITGANGHLGSCLVRKLLSDNNTVRGLYLANENNHIPDNVEEIYSYAFYGNQLTTITIGNGIKMLGEGAFYKDNNSNTNLESITIDKSCSVIKNMSNYPWIGDDYRTGTTIYGSNNEVCDSW